MTASLEQLARRVSGRPVGPLASPADLETQVTDATHDSRQVKPGWLYCCVPGLVVDGHDFAAQALADGAAGLLVDRRLPIDVAQIEVADVRAALGPAAAEIHNDPSQELTVVGVTGTNGKSSIVQLMADIWRQVGTPAEIVGTLVGSRTTPEGTDLQRLFRAAANRGVKAAAIEVSSHALSLHRVGATRFRAAVFTNLGRDHLDFHHTVENYFEAKASLFTPELADHGVVNGDDPFGRRLLDSAPVPLVEYRLDHAVDLTFDGAISRFRWRGHEVVLQLAGAHNVLNALAAATTAEVLGIDTADIADALCATSPVRGRFEAVDAGQPFHIAVDYAHTPDALTAALAAARQVAGERRVLVVFGCGGDRDVQKRAEMGRVAEQGADVVVVTSDNPRSEDPNAIIDNILEGVADAEAMTVEPDRQSAISAAIAAASAGDIVLIAGKGHETYQVIGDETIEFDDRRAALVALGVVAA